MSEAPPIDASAAAAEADRERGRITQRAGIVAAGTLLSRVLGLVREQALAAMFSRGATDAFFVAFTIPNVLRQLLAEGAVQTAVLPVLTKVREQQGEAEARRFFRAIRGLSLVVLLGVSLVGVLFAPALVELFAGGYKAHPGQFERTVTLTRWVFPYIFFMGTAALGVAALNTYHRFVVTSFAPGLLNVAFIACALLLPSWLGARGYDAMLAMAIGALLGGVLQMIAQWPSLHAIGYLGLPSFAVWHPGVGEVLRRMVPVLFGIGVYYVDVILARRFLSELEVGAQSYFNFALRLCDFPQGIFVMALQTATLPSLALLAARGDKAELTRTFAFGMRLALFVGVPATALFVVLAEPIVVLIFQRGEFDRVASHETARALVAQGLGIWTVAGVRQLVGVFYAVGDTRSPVLVSAVDLAAFVGLALLLRGPFGHVGVGYAVSGASAVQLVLLWALLGRHLEHRALGEVGRSLLRTILAAGVASAAGLAVSTALSGMLTGGALARLVPGTAAAVGFGLVFLGGAWLLRCQELETITQPVLRRLGRRQGQT